MNKIKRLGGNTRQFAKMLYFTRQITDLRNWVRSKADDRELIEWQISSVERSLAIDAALFDKICDTRGAHDA